MSDEKPKPTVIDPVEIEGRKGSSYPQEFAGVVGEREKRALGDALGLGQFGVNLVHLPPGTASSQRHWHTREDEFVFMLEGELVLITDAGERTLLPGRAAGFPAGKPDGHQLVNRSDRTAVYLEVGTRIEGDEVDYPDIDMRLEYRDGKRVFVHKDGTPY